MNKEKEIIKLNFDSNNCVILDEEYNKLSERCDEIDVKKQNSLMRETILALKDTMKENNLLYLCSNQIGYDKRIFVIKFGEEYKTFINPIITKADNLTIEYETCVSIPGKTYIRPRHTGIHVTYQTPLGKIESRQLIGKAATLFQHCIDHLNGLLITDVGMEIDKDFINATDEEKQEILKMYMESLDMKRKEVNDIIKEDEKLTKMHDAIQFMEEVAVGKVNIKTEKLGIKGDKKHGDK